MNINTIKKPMVIEKVEINLNKKGGIPYASKF